MLAIRSYGKISELNYYITLLSTRTSGRYRALVLVPRFARQNLEKSFYFNSLHYITSLFTFICLHYMSGLGWEEHLTIYHILGSLNFVVLAFVEREP